MQTIQQSTTRRVLLRAFLASDHITAATGLTTLAVQISKNGGAFGNPNAGATNATEIANGWYYVDLDATDSNTAGPLIVRATHATVDPVEVVFQVGVIPANTVQVGGTVQTGRDLGASVLLSSGTGTGQVSLSSGIVAANLKQLNGALTDGTPAEADRPSLYLKKLSCRNPAGGTTDAAAEFIGTGAGGRGMGIIAQAEGSGAGIYVLWGTGGDGILFSGDFDGGEAIEAGGHVSNIGVKAVDTNEAALATVANQTTILNRLGAWTGTGLNTILGALRAVFNKAADLTPTDLSTGGTGNNTTDSLEAIRDAIYTGTPPTADAIADAVLDEAKGSHTGLLAGVALDSTVAKDATVAKAATALNNETWTDAKAAYLDAAITSRLATAGYTAPLSAAGTRTALGMAAANLDVQLSEIDSAVDTSLEAGTSQTFTFHDTAGDPVPGMDVWITNDAAGAVVVRRRRQTNASGQVTIALPAGTYYLWRELLGTDLSSVNPQTIVVT